MDDDEMDYEREYISSDNKVTITNVAFLDSPPIENEYLRALKLLQIFNSDIFNTNKQTEGENKKQAKKQKIQSLLINSIERIDNLINFLKFSCYEKNFFKFKVLPEERSIEKDNFKLRKLNYIKKVECLNTAINNFGTKLQQINDEKIASQIIFNELINLKELGFKIENNFTFPPLKENMTFRLTHMILDNTENILKTQKYFFLLTYNTKSKKFELNNDFYNNWKNKFSLKFEAILQLGNNNNLHIDFEKILDSLILDNLAISQKNDIEKYKIHSYLSFYIKYLIYSIFKVELRSLSNIADSNFFKFRNFNFITKELNKEFSITATYFNIFKLTVRMKKEPKDDLVLMGQKDPNIFTDFHSEEIDFSGLMICDEDRNPKNNTVFKKYSPFIKSLLINIIAEVKSSRVIKDFENSSIKNESLLEAIDTSLFVRNIYKLSNYILKEYFIDSIINKLDSFKHYYWINSLSVNIFNQTYKFLVSDVSFNTRKFEFYFIFDDKNSQFSFEYKHFTMNTVQLFERETVIIEKHFKEPDFEFIILTIENLLTN
jgi:hypothetical protein